MVIKDTKTLHKNTHLWVVSLIARMKTMVFAIPQMKKYDFLSFYTSSSANKSSRKSSDDITSIPLRPAKSLVLFETITSHPADLAH